MATAPEMTDSPTSLPAEMTAVEITEPGGPEVLQPTTRPVPTPAAGEVLIRVAAAGINRPDIFQRNGNYPPPPGASDLPGLEVSGTIAAVGPGADRWQPGAPVCALLAGGGYAEYAVAPAPQVLPVPDGLDMVAAAALPETAFTVWTNLVDGGRLADGETLLVHGGSSGIGTMAIQLGRALGAKVIVTVGNAEKAAACLELGAAHAIDYQRQDFAEAVREATDGAGVDVILDMVAARYLADNVALLRPGGRLVIIALLGGAKAEINLATVMRNRLTVTGSTLRPRSVAEKAAIADALHQRVWPLIGQGKIKPLIYKTFPLADAAAAHALMESSAHIGKIILSVAP